MRLEPLRFRRCPRNGKRVSCVLLSHFASGLHGKADIGATPLASPDTGLDDCYRIAVGDVNGAIGVGKLVYGNYS